MTQTKLSGRNKGREQLLMLLEYLIAFFCIMMGGGIWMRQSYSLLYQYFLVIPIIVDLLILIWFLFAVGKRYAMTKPYLFFSVLSIICFCLILVNSAHQMMGSVRMFFAPAILGLLVGCFVRPERFWSLMDKYLNLMILIASVSIAFWLFGSLLHIIKPSGTIRFEWDITRSARHYHYLYFEPFWQQSVYVFGKIIPRNCSIFTEAPMCGFALNLSYSFYRMHESERQNWLVKILLIFATITTFSVTAIIYLIIFEVIIHGLNWEGSLKIKLLKTVLFVVILAASIFIIRNLITDKLSSGSGKVRIDHFNASWILFKSTFPFGCGIWNSSAFENLELYRQGVSVGLPSFYARSGVGGMVLTIYPIVTLVISGFQNKKSIFVAFAAAFLWSNICTVVQLNTPVVWLLFFYMARGADFQYVYKKTTHFRRVKLVYN